MAKSSRPTNNNPFDYSRFNPSRPNTGSSGTSASRVDRSGQPGTGSYRKQMKNRSASVGAGSQSRARNRKPK